MEPIIIYPKRTNTFLYILMSLGFVLAAAIVWFTDIPEISEFLRWAMIPSGFFFAICALIFVKRLLNPKPLLIIDDKGIADHSSTIMGFDPFPWEEVIDIKLTYYLNQTFISVYLIDEDKYINQVNVWKKMAYMANRKLGFPLVNITLNTSGENPEFVFLQIQDEYGHRYINKTKEAVPLS